MTDEKPARAAGLNGAELTTWSIIYSLLGWLSLAAAMFGGAGEAPYYLAIGLALVPLSVGFWFRWGWARWAGLIVFAAIAAWAAWQLTRRRTQLLSIALLFTSAETLWCLSRWPARKPTT